MKTILIIKFIEYLRQYKNISNPFLNKNFDIKGDETFSEGNWHHKLLDINMYYLNDSLKIIFLIKDKEIAFYLFHLISENNYAYDPEWKFFLNNKEIDNNCETLINLLDKLETINEFKIYYSKTESGKNAFDVGKQIIWYPITEWKSDSYYFNKEWKRWKKN